MPLIFSFLFSSSILIVSDFINHFPAYINARFSGIYCIKPFSLLSYGSKKCLRLEIGYETQVGVPFTPNMRRYDGKPLLLVHGYL